MDNSVNILGTIYHVWYQPMLDAKEDSRFDEIEKDIYIRCDNVRNVKDFEELKRKALQREIIRAFAIESGVECPEEFLQWVVRQHDKINKVFAELEIG